MHKVFIDLGYGDAGKGITVARAVMNEPTAGVVKFAGGAQCAHNVIVGDRHHTFSQFGSGALLGAPTLLTNDFIVDIPAIIREADHLSSLGIQAPTFNLFISSDCLIITQAMVAANQSLEDARGQGRHGSTGRGIGTTVAYDVATGNGVRAKDLHNTDVLLDKIIAQREWLKTHHNVVLKQSALHEAMHLQTITDTWLNIGPESGWLDMFMDTRSSLIFEGSQGVLLDENIGFFPHVTRATTTAKNAHRVIDDIGGAYSVYGIVRTYMTRHGAGPMPTEADNLASLRDGDHNDMGQYQGAFRRGYFDVSAIKYALKHTYVNGLVVTHADIELPLAFSDPYEDVAYGDFDDRTQSTRGLFARRNNYTLGHIATPENIGGVLGLPIWQIGYGPEINDYMV
jgi:adenylosuccinate synthase